jgi:hypothetical protein
MLIVPPINIVSSAGGPPAFSPSDLTGIFDWWTSKAGVTESSGAVSDWVGQFASTSMPQSTGANKPVYSATSFNSSYPGISFDRSAPSFLQNTSVNFAASAAFSFFMLWMPVSVDNFGGYLSFVASGQTSDFNSPGSMAITPTTTLETTVVAFNQNSFITGGATTGFTANIPQLYGLVCNTSGAGEEAKNGGTLTSPGTPAGLGGNVGGSGTNISFGSRVLSGGASVTMTLALIIMTRSLLTQTDADNIADYCNAQFGTAF